MSSFFYDSYAVIEYLRDNPSFRPYFDSHAGILSLLNVLEVYYSVLNESGEEKAEVVIETLWPLIVEPAKETVKKAMAFRLKNKKQSLSYADCLGYQIALEHGVKFLTGDSQFKKMENVEFVR